MNIEVKISKIFPKDEKLKAIVNVTLDGSFAVHGIRIFNSEKGLFVTMPSQKTATGEYKDIFHAVNKQAREKLMNAILAEYEKVKA